MKVSYFELKEAVYVMIPALGAILLFISFFSLNFASNTVAPVSDLVSGIVLAIAGIACMLFGLTTWIIRDDPQVWD